MPSPGEPTIRRPWLTRRNVNLLLAGLVLLFVGVGASTVYRAAFGERERSDFTVYQAAGQAVVQGTNIYEAKNVRGWYFTALPLFAIVSVPLGMLSKAAGSAVWYLICTAALLHAAWVAARLAERTSGASRAGPVGTALAGLALTAWPWLSGLTRGQVSVLLAWLVIVAIDAFLRYPKSYLRLFAGGLALSGAIVAKAFPGLLIGWIILRGQWRATVITMLALFLLLVPVPSLVFGWSENAALLHRWVTRVALPLGDAQQEAHARYDQMLDPRIDKNQSLQAVAIRIAAPSEEPGEADPRESTARYAATGLGLLLLGLGSVACLVSGRRALRGEEDGLAVGVRQASIFILLSLFLAPLAWTHYYTVALLPVSVAAAAGFGGGMARPWSRRYAAATTAWAAGYALALVPLFYELGTHLFAGLALWAVLVWHLLSPTSHGSPVATGEEESGARMPEGATPAGYPSV